MKRLSRLLAFRFVIIADDFWSQWNVVRVRVLRFDVYYRCQPFVVRSSLTETHDPLPLSHPHRCSRF
jgi:hypothetical protein